MLTTVSEKKTRNVVPLDVTPDLAAKIDKVAELLDMPKAQVMRLAIKLGLCDLERVDYQIEKLISHAAHPNLEIERKKVSYLDSHRPTPAARVAENSEDNRNVISPQAKSRKGK